MLLSYSNAFIYSQLKEGYSSNAIPREVPELVRVLLTQYPDALDCGRRQSRFPVCMDIF